MKRMNPLAEDRAEAAATEYFISEGIDPSDTVMGFIKKNNLGDHSTEDIAAIIETAKNLQGGTLIGSGDRFKLWCGKMGRELPTDEVVSSLNEDEYMGEQLIVVQIPDHSKVWLSYCSYRAGRGR